MDPKDLEVWKKSMELVEVTYKISANFPVSEMYGLTNQLRRASVSVVSNIAEGSGRNSDKELLYFLNVSLGSLAEVETQFEENNAYQERLWDLNEKTELYKLLETSKKQSTYLLVRNKRDLDKKFKAVKDSFDHQKHFEKWTLYYN